MIAPLIFLCTVSVVTDGDTLRCKDGTRVRLQAVAARELDGRCGIGHPCPKASGIAARDALVRIAGGHTLRCEKAGMNYKRVTAWCWRADGVQVNCAMIESGTTLLWSAFDPKGRMCRE